MLQSGPLSRCSLAQLALACSLLGVIQPVRADLLRPGFEPSAVSGSLIPAPASSPSWSVRKAPQAGASPVSRLVSLGSEAPPSKVVPAAPLPLADLTPPSPLEGQQLALLPSPRPYRLRPSLGGGKPTGFVGGWGDYFIAGTAGTRGDASQSARDFLDGSVNVGLSLGDPVKAIGVDLYWGNGSIKDFNANGAFGATAGRLLINRYNLQLAVAGGVIDAVPYGDEPGRRISSPYGAITVATPLRPRDPSFQQWVQFSAGGGGAGFADIDANFQTSSSGFFAAAGVELLPNLGFSAGVSNRATVVNVSYIPFRDLPIFVNMAAADVFNATPYGVSALLSVGWSDNWRTGYFHSTP